jgi:hypothetical protein
MPHDCPKCEHNEQRAAQAENKARASIASILADLEQVETARDEARAEAARARELLEFLADEVSEYTAGDEVAWPDLTVRLQQARTFLSSPSSGAALLEELNELREWQKRAIRLVAEGITGKVLPNGLAEYSPEKMIEGFAALLAELEGLRNALERARAEEPELLDETGPWRFDGYHADNAYSAGMKDGRIAFARELTALRAAQPGGER